MRSLILASIALATISGCLRDEAETNEPHRPIPSLSWYEKDKLHDLSIQKEGSRVTVTGGALVQTLELPAEASIQAVQPFKNGKQMLCIDHPRAKKIFYLCACTREQDTPEGGKETLSYWIEIKGSPSSEETRGHILDKKGQLQREINSMLETPDILEKDWYKVAYYYSVN